MSFISSKMRMASSSGEVLLFEAGTQLYITGSSPSAIHRYTLSTPWDLSTGTYSNEALSLSGTTTGVFLKDDLTRLYVCNVSSDDIEEYTLSSPGDLTTASLSFTYTTSQVNPYSLSFTPDGTKLHYTSNASDAIHQVSLATAWDLSSAVSPEDGSFTYGEGSTGRQGHFFSNDGTHLFIIDTNNNEIDEFTLSVAYDITSTTSYINNVTGVGPGPEDGFLKPDDISLYIAGNTNDNVDRYDFGTAKDITTLNTTAVSSLDVSGQQSRPYAVYINPLDVFE